MIECKYEKWEIIDDEWNHDFVCTKGIRRYCMGYKCPDFEEKKDDDRRSNQRNREKN